MLNEQFGKVGTGFSKQTGTVWEVEGLRGLNSSRGWSISSVSSAEAIRYLTKWVCGGGAGP